MEIRKQYLDLLEESFPGIRDSIIRCEALGFFWEASKLFIKEVNGRVLSHVALLEYPMLIDGKWHKMGSLHGICTKVDHQRRGFATELIVEALQWAKERCDAVLLFTGIPSFYEKLSFQRVQEYRFYLSRPSPKGSRLLRPITAPHDNALFLRCFREQEPISNRLWIKDNGLVASFNALFATYPVYWSAHYSPMIDGLIFYEIRDTTLHLLDVVARKMPTLDTILEHLPTAVDGIYFYFSPERFTNEAIPEPYVYDNNHLLVYGPWLDSGPYMIAPLSRC